MGRLIQVMKSPYIRMLAGGLPPIPAASYYSVFVRADGAIGVRLDDGSYWYGADEAHTHANVLPIYGVPDANKILFVNPTGTDIIWAFLDASMLPVHPHDHNVLNNLAIGDPHPQYHNDARGDARYYTQAQIATLLSAYYTSALLNAGQLNTLYYTETEIDAKFGLYYTKVELNAGQLNTLYYTKTNVQTSGQALVHWDNLTNVPSLSIVGHTHIAANITDFTAAVNALLAAYYTKVNLQTSGQALVHWDNLTNVPSLAAAVHTHVVADITDYVASINGYLANYYTSALLNAGQLNNIYYTETEIDALLAPLTANNHAHVNFALLQTYTQTEANLADAVAKKHAHVNLALLETYTQTNANLATAVTNTHVAATVVSGTGVTVGLSGQQVTVTLNNTAVVAGTYNLTTLTVDAQGRLTAAATAYMERTIVTVVASKTLALSDRGTKQMCAAAGAIVITVPTNAAVAFAIGTEIDIFRNGAGAVSVAASGGVTIRTAGTLVITAQWRAAHLTKIATDEWVLIGAV